MNTCIRRLDKRLGQRSQDWFFFMILASFLLVFLSEHLSGTILGGAYERRKDSDY